MLGHNSHLIQLETGALGKMNISQMWHLMVIIEVSRGTFTVKAN